MHPGQGLECLLGLVLGTELQAEGPNVVTGQRLLGHKKADEGRAS